MQIGRDEKLNAIATAALPGNHDMLALTRHVGFKVLHVPGGTDCQVRMRL